MGNLNHVTFERSLTPADAIGVPILCIFSDASNEAFGFLDGRPRAISITHGSYPLSQESLLKPLTIPRLELQAAVLAIRLYQAIIIVIIICKCTQTV